VCTGMRDPDRERTERRVDEGMGYGQGSGRGVQTPTLGRSNPLVGSDVAG